MNGVMVIRSEFMSVESPPAVAELVYLGKLANRFKWQPGDWTAAPETWSGFTWEGVENNRIPWVAMKLAFQYLDLPELRPDDQHD